MADLIQSIDPIEECARALRKIFLDEDFGSSVLWCQWFTRSLEKIKMHGQVMNFMSVLFNFNSNNCTRKNEDDDQEDDEIWDHNPEVPVSKQRKMMSLYQIIHFIIHNGRKMTPLHILNAEAIHQTCRSTALITSFNHFSLCTSYDKLQRYHNDSFICS